MIFFQESKLPIAKLTVNIDSKFTSVGEQSGIRAGDGGFQLDVKGKTDLKGGAISSTQVAIDSKANSYNSAGGTTLTDLSNSASFKAEGFQVSAGVGTAKGGGAGVGSDKGNVSSTTTAAISGVAGDKDARTGDKESGIAKIFDADKVTKDVNAQVTIIGEFGKRAAKEVGDYAGKKLTDLKKQASNESDPTKKAALLADAAKWEEGGAYRVALHTAVGGLTGGVQGAVGAATSQTAVPVLGDALKEANLPVELKEALILAAGTAVGAATGGTAGAGAGLNATGNNYLSATDLRTRAQRLAAARKSGNVEEEVKILKEYDTKSAKNTGSIDYKSVLTEGQLQAEKAQLEKLANDPSATPETRAQAKRSINELNTALNVIQKSPVLRDAAELGLIAADVLTLGELAVTKALTSAMVKEIVATRTGKVISDDAAAAITNNFYRDGASSHTLGLDTSAGIIPANPNKTTTVLGRYDADMKKVINDQMLAPNSVDFGARPGGFNVLNVPSNAVENAGSQFFETINKPFLDAAVKRGDDIALATIPKKIDDVLASNGALKGNFAYELDYLVRNNYKPVNVSPAQWEIIKGCLNP